MAKIQYIKDKENVTVYPVTHERAVRDSNNVLLETKLASFITASVNSLTNYYLKSEIYTKTEVDDLIAAINQFSYETASSLPSASASTMYKIYLIPAEDPKTQNAKDEYITVRSGSSGSYTYTWEQIGSTAIDLDGYVTTTDLNTSLANYTTTSNLTTLLAAKQDTLVSSTNIKTINNTSLLGSGNISVQETLVSGTNIKTINNESIIGNGNLSVVTDISGKQDTLVSGTNIKTVNGESLLGSGNITAGDPDAVKYVSQELTEAQKAQARTNIGAVGPYTVSSQQDGTVDIISDNGDTVTIDLNHTHDGMLPEVTSSDNDKIMKVVGGEWTLSVGSQTYTLPIASSSVLGGVMIGNSLSINSNTGEVNVGTSYPKYVLLADEAAYVALATKDSGTLYLIPKE